MKVICSLCEREGKPGYLGEREPLDNPEVTHGLCSPHTEQLLESIPSRSFPDAELLIVVRPNDTELYEYLQRSFAGVHHVKVIVERRGGDRRREQGLVTLDLRQQPRDRKSTRLNSSHGYISYAVFCLKKKKKKKTKYNPKKRQIDRYRER